MPRNLEPYKGIALPETDLAIQSVNPAQLLPDIEQEIIIQGQGLIEETWIEIEDCQTLWTELTGNDALTARIKSSNEYGNKRLTVKRHAGEQAYDFPNFVSVFNPTENNATDNLGWLELNQNVELSIGKDAGVDIRHYKNCPVERNSDGLYIEKTGWVMFPLLSWNRSNQRSVDFVFYLKGDRYFSFGLAHENFNFNSSDSKQCICSFRLSRDKLEYAYGNGLTDKYGYKQIKKNHYYRFRFNNNGNRGEMAQLFQLKGKEKQHWNDGELIWAEPVPQNFPETGNNLTPIILEYNDEENILMGVRVI